MHLPNKLYRYNESAFVDMIEILKSIEHPIGVYDLYKKVKKKVVSLEIYNKLRTITLDKYLEFLKSNYNMSNSELSFRNEVGRFYRIYGRENLQEKKPLHLFNADSALNCINSLLKLFNKYSAIIEIELKYNAIKKEKKAIDQADEYSLVRKISAKEYKANIKKIEELAKQIDEIISKTDAGLKDNNSTVTDEVLRLKQELSKLRISRSRYIHERNKLSTYRSSKINKKQYNQLQTFFPNVNLERINELVDCIIQI